MKEYGNYIQNGFEKETQEKLNIPVVRQRFIERRKKLQKEWEYYTNTLNSGSYFSDWVHGYYKTIPTRLIELDYIIENVV